MKIARAEVENFQKITVIDISFNDRVTEISGPNGAGKSSTFLAMHATLESAAMPDDPIRHGADSFAIRTHLKGDDDSTLIVTKRGRRDRDGKMVYDLALETPDGARFPQPATHLKKLISDHLLDPLQFLDMSDDQQFNVLRSFVPDFDFAANKRAYDGKFATRTEVNRDQKKAQAAADAIDVLDNAPGEKVDEAGLTAELENAGTKNLEIQQANTNRQSTVERIEQLRADAKAKLDEIADAIQSEKESCDEFVSEQRALISESEQQINLLRAQMDALEKQITDRRSKVKAREEGLATALANIENSRRSEANALTKEADDLQARIDSAAPIPTPVDAAAITAKLNEARRINRLIEDWEAQRARKAAHQREADAYSKQSDDLTAKLAEIEHAKQEAIQKAHLPVSGVGFGDGFVTFNGAPFNQASKAERMRTAFALCMAKRPQLRFCWIQDASLLDEDSWKFIEQLAEEFDCQVLLETVRPNSGSAILLEDGHVKGVEAEPKLTAVAKPAVASANDPTPDAPPAPRTRKRFVGPGAPTDGAA
jgi:phosphopantetheinyl transferase (holo-ACP synthase)